METQNRASANLGYVKKRILELFDKVKRKYKEVLDKEDNISLDADSIVYVVGELQNFCLIEAERDSVADAFETIDFSTTVASVPFLEHAQARDPDPDNTL